MKVTVVGIGYVGIHSVVNLATNINVNEVVAFDINSSKIELYNQGKDVTCEVGDSVIAETLSRGVIFTNNSEKIKDSDIYIVAVPTDASTNGELHLGPLEKASEVIGENLKDGSIIVYESTVYPGFTEEVCIPIIQENTSKKFEVVYTPERVDPGNKVNTVENTPRVISGTSSHATNTIIDIYSNYIINMVPVSQIKVAESVKILENTQRDVNIALMNNFATLMLEMDISVSEVLEAAKTKWNFCDFTPGLVGGHCIGVDPYYLLHKMKEMNLDTNFIESSRQVNENILQYIENVICKINPSKILFVGATFKPNTNDIRNSKNLELAHNLSNVFDVTIFDPMVDKYSVYKEEKYDLVIFSVIHKEFSYEKIMNLECDKINLTNYSIDESIWNLM